MKKVIAVLGIVLALALVSFGQNPPTNAPQFQVNMNFLQGTPFGQQSAISNAFTYQFTTDTQLRADVIVMPGANYTGYFGGAQYSLCGVKGFANLLATTSLNCGKFSPYVNGAVGFGRIQIGSLPVDVSLAGLMRTGANFDPTGTGKFTLNLYECGWGHYGTGANGWSCQSGISFGLGSNAAATQAKMARWQRAQAKKQAKLMKAAEQSQ